MIRNPFRRKWRTIYAGHVEPGMVLREWPYATVRSATQIFSVMQFDLEANGWPHGFMVYRNFHDRVQVKRERAK